MRLTLALLKWPKVRPNGHIFIGKYRMVRKVRDKHLEDMRRDIEREKANAFLCMHPAISWEREQRIMEKQEEEGPRQDQVWFRMRRARVEQQQRMVPVPLSEHFKSLRKEEKW